MAGSEGGTSGFLRGEVNFRWRGGSVSRVEALSDAVFGLALTLLVVTLQVPGSFDEMMSDFRRLPVFLVCFGMLVLCWYHHFLFHRRYGLEDGVTILLNVVLLFVVLFYVVPLRFLFTALFEMFGLLRYDDPLPPGYFVHGVRTEQMRPLMLVYGAGFAVLFALFGLLNLHAWRLREALALDVRERFLTMAAARAHFVTAGIGVLSILLAAAGDSFVAASGWVYFLGAPVHIVLGVRTGRGLARLPATSPAP
jgi:uncharacterized membrane protein